LGDLAAQRSGGVGGAAPVGGGDVGQHRIRRRGRGGFESASDPAGQRRHRGAGGADGGVGAGGGGGSGADDVAAVPAGVDQPAQAVAALAGGVAEAGAGRGGVVEVGAAGGGAHGEGAQQRAEVGACLFGEGGQYVGAGGDAGEPPVFGGLLAGVGDVEVDDDQVGGAGGDAVVGGRPALPPGAHLVGVGAGRPAPFDQRFVLGAGGEREDAPSPPGGGQGVV